ncbi:DEAD/DEAH box helicase [Stratiformator vulcanicus]|uniref:DEAD-box ATP-dependent RNA helicase RhpA n=1 Tax=Stratiformator vulcanicus TaxID=2527980 RepID=A0A517R3T6_9PLAN|nr:DEAD/DEAH box helicase [Stratiformator vulcanicus]QDT38552.1 ATP-dependent RNA helicase RhlE [Stratiformator vulcanicus]
MTVQRLAAEPLKGTYGSEATTVSEGNTLKNFADSQLIAPVLKALVQEGYEVPTAIQAETIPAAMAGRDVLGCAQTGTGKTAAFALPLLHRLGTKPGKAKPNQPRVLVLAPTRELAIQIGDSFSTYGRQMHLRQALVYGGVGQQKQVQALRRGVHILVATPGRLLDLMNQGHISLDQLEAFVVDEADRMLDMGFLPSLKKIIATLPVERQSLFFSATMPPKIVELTEQLLNDPLQITIEPEQADTERIAQRVLFVEQSDKTKVLEGLLTADDVGQAVVFTRTKRRANDLAARLSHHGLAADAIHGNKSQNARQRTLDAFRRGKFRVLVATDLAARGIDVDGITHVINFELPDEAENYLHRIGRTGRAGATGWALTLCSGGERGDLKAIERLLGNAIPVDPEHPARGFSGGGGSGEKPRRNRRRDSGPGKRPKGGPRSKSKSSGGTPSSGSSHSGSSSSGSSSSHSGGPKSSGKSDGKVQRRRRNRSRTDRNAATNMQSS